MSTPYINQLPRRTFSAFDAQFNQHLQQMTDMINSLAGFHGVIPLQNHLDMGGNTIRNAGSPVDSGDVVTQAFAQSNYSAAAIRPQLEANGSTPLQSVRRLNDSTQREKTSSWLNYIMSTAPSATTAQVSFSTSGGNTTITVNATNLVRADGSIQPLAGYTMTKPNPASYAISSISRTAGVVSATFASLPPIASGSPVYVASVTDSSFDGTFIVTSAAGVTLTWNQNMSNGSSTGGNVSTGGVYYIYAVPGNMQMFSVGPYSGDTPQNRINASNDGKQIVAVAVLTAGGGSPSQSGGGGTPSTGAVNAGTFF